MVTPGPFAHGSLGADTTPCRTSPSDAGATQSTEGDRRTGYRRTCDGSLRAVMGMIDWLLALPLPVYPIAVVLFLTVSCVTGGIVSLGTPYLDAWIGYGLEGLPASLNTVRNCVGRSVFPQVEVRYPSPLALLSLEECDTARDRCFDYGMVGAILNPGFLLLMGMVYAMGKTAESRCGGQRLWRGSTATAVTMLREVCR